MRQPSPYRWLILVAALGCDPPDDGVQSLAFLLETPPASETRVVPPEAETGVPPFALAQARGRCHCDVPARSVRCTFEGLPAATTGRPPAYELALLVWYRPLAARFDARALDR